MHTDDNRDEKQGFEEQTEEREYIIKDISEILEEEPHTIRNWLKELEGYIPFTKKKNGYRIFKKDGLERFQLIKHLNRDQEYTLKEIALYLDTGGEAFKPVPEISADSILADEMRRMRERLDQLEERDKKRDEVLMNLAEQLTKQNTYIEHTLQERNENLTAAMREMLEGKKLTAVSQHEEQPTKKGWFQRLLGK
ncbi:MULTISPECIES: MerR family transcriptional regulator [Priestia]|jgi:DNA-binding transcriptional MerR regulator|uniref:MerR family transcriptional regulator n=1 Tax=Priestia TaxID=2800373 RepID=UPI00196B5551|nr:MULTISPECIES: MerR family transcriptional regulator [Priestia]MBU8589201.1 helix-turn-helix domain-containing protein [Priestia megaterium]MBV6738369.1 helix-turn-helix domain-containing protein [Priestia megaterium]MCG0050233.1 helix-turn-helix domain-containing protein [Priestia aryabhattai]MDD1515775.1 MerR family transcriptional regulator [Priestia megaterium]MDF2013261.1 MerR family transcriptional regulator [Priestia megaterium]